MRTTTRTLAAAVAQVLVLSLLAAPAIAQKPQPYQPPQPPRVPSVATRDVPPLSKKDTNPPSVRLNPPAWPGAGSIVVSSTAGQPAEVFSREQAKAAGVDGVLARVDGPRGTRVDVSVDYSSFATGYGAGWAGRLRLVTLPDCALYTPDLPQCVAKPLASRNNFATRTVSASVLAGTLVATESTSAGGSGDFTATKLQPSSTWEAGGNSGAYNWSYPMRVPPAVGGPAPAIELTYSSQSVDGLMAATNNQPGWAGGGLELAPGGSIERRYKPCADDMTGGNNANPTGDLCWARDNAVLSLAGHSGELLYNATEQRWHLRNDDGTRIELKTGATNGDNDGEYWVVTTRDGTQYWFGRNRLPGWTSPNDTKSAWTVPVYGNQLNEPCHQSTFAASSCPQAWRWNLDYVIDMNGNSMSLWYATETNKYAANLNTSSPVSYVRDGTLAKIEYGTKSNKDLVTDPTQTTSADSIFTAAAPMEVEFVPDNRCLSSCTIHDGTHWTDTPWDRECLGSTCTVTSPTFWSTKRLKQINTKVRNGSSYRVVETWTLTHSYPDPGDTTPAPLRLERIAHSTATDSVPDITFGYVQKNNRVDPIAGDGLAPMNWFRLSQITTETGGTITVDYSDADCVAGGKLPDKAALQNNTYRCYPVRWRPEGSVNPIVEFFHKYVVLDVRETDNTGGVPPFGSPEVLHSYTYPVDGAAWHYTDEDGLIKDEDKNWSVWRGYQSVAVTTGKPGQGDALTYTKSTFLRGMHGDHLPSGTRSVSLPAVDMNGDGDTTDAGIDAPAVNDEDTWAGWVRSTVTTNGPGGAEISSTVNQPWRSAATATRTIDGVTVEARMTGVEATHSRVKLDHAPNWRTSSTFTQFDGYGMAVKEDDFGDDSLGTDDQCTVTSYQRNVNAWILTTEKEVTTFALTCAAAANPASLTEADVISNARNSFDGLAWGATPTKGQPTQVATATAWTAGNPTDQAITTTTYDAQGRVTETYDALNRKTTTAYTPTSGGPLTQTLVTQPSPFNFTTTTTLDPAYGLPTLTVDTNGKRTEQTYDGLGRLKAVWLPGRDKASQTANLTFDYQINRNAPSVVVANKLNPVEGYTTTYTLYDGLLRTRQTQAPSPSGGRVLTDQFYDTAGRAKRTYDAYHDSRGGPGVALVTPLDQHDVAGQTYFLYDGAGRTTDAVFDPYNNGERWRTHTAYTGDRIDVTPPAGGTATSTFTDARGNATALWQYGYPTAADHVTTTYTYNRKNQLSQVKDNATNVWNYIYWLAGQVKTAQDPDAGTSTTNFDKAGQLTSSQNTLGQTLVYDYDNLGRRIGLYLGSKSTANKLATWGYDTAFFDATATPVKGQLSSSTRWTTNGTVPYTNAVRGYYADYSSSGAVYTIPSAESGLANTYTYISTNRPDGSTESLQYPGFGDLGDEATTIGYEPTLGLPYNLTAIDENSEYSYVSQTIYDSLARVSQYTLYTGLFSSTGSKAWLSFDRELETGRLTNISTSRESVAPNAVTNLNYTYDNAGNITRITDTANSNPANWDTQCFTYDKLRRLTQAWTPSTASCATAPSTNGLGGPAKYWHSWTINAVGNRTQQVEHATAVGGTDKTADYTYPAAGSSQPHTVTGTTGATVGTYKYDSAGNTTCRPVAASNVCPSSGTTGSQILTWDAEGHLASSQDSTGTTQYLYDADGNRLIRTDPAGKTLYLPGQELRYSGGTSSTTRYYAFNGVTIASRNGSGLTWLTGDHQGTADVAITATTQATVIRRQTPYGGSRGTSVSWPNTRGFVNGVKDNTGLTHLGAREYDPTLGKFISVDPIFNQNDPQSINNFAYSNGNPVTMSDPTGTIAKDPADHGTVICNGSENSYGCGSGGSKKGGPKSGRKDPGKRGGRKSSGKQETSVTKSAVTCHGSENSGGCGYVGSKPCVDKGEHSCAGMAVDSSGENQEDIMWDRRQKKMVTGKPCGMKCFSKWGCVPGQYCGTSLPEPGGTAGICGGASLYGFLGAGGGGCVQADQSGVFGTATGTHSFTPRGAGGVGVGRGLALELSDAKDPKSLSGEAKFFTLGPITYSWTKDSSGNDVHILDIGVASRGTFGILGGRDHTAVSDYWYHW